MNKKITIGIIILAIIIGAYLVLRESRKTPQPALQERETAVPASSEEPQTASIKEIKMTSDSFSFSPRNVTVKKGEPVKISFTNVGIHTFTVDELNVDVPLRGFSPVAEFTPTKAGTFEYYCKIPGHREAGQVGVITVE